jgi:hypothetical protein
MATFKISGTGWLCVAGPKLWVPVVKLTNSQLAEIRLAEELIAETEKKREEKSNS